MRTSDNTIRLGEMLDEYFGAQVSGENEYLADRILKFLHVPGSVTITKEGLRAAFDKAWDHDDGMKLDNLERVIFGEDLEES